MFNERCLLDEAEMETRKLSRDFNIPLDDTHNVFWFAYLSRIQVDLLKPIRSQSEHLLSDMSFSFLVTAGANTHKRFPLALLWAYEIPSKFALIKYVLGCASDVGYCMKPARGLAKERCIF